jgi:hypothetical protein
MITNRKIKMFQNVLNGSFRMLLEETNTVEKLICIAKEKIKQKVHRIMDLLWHS